MSEFRASFYGTLCLQIIFPVIPGMLMADTAIVRALAGSRGHSFRVFMRLFQTARERKVTMTYDFTGEKSGICQITPIWCV